MEQDLKPSAKAGPTTIPLENEVVAPDNKVSRVSHSFAPQFFEELAKIMPDEIKVSGWKKIRFALLRLECHLLTLVPVSPFSGANFGG